MEPTSQGTGSCSGKQGMDAGLSRLAGCPLPQVGPSPLPWGHHRQVLHLPPGGLSAPPGGEGLQSGGRTAPGLDIPPASAKARVAPWGWSCCRTPHARHCVGAIKPWAPRLLPGTPHMVEREAEAWLLPGRWGDPAKPVPGAGWLLAELTGCWPLLWFPGSAGTVEGPPLWSRLGCASHTHWETIKWDFLKIHPQMASLWEVRWVCALVKPK